MKTIIRCLILSCVASVATLTARAQAPANDLFVNAITLNGPIVVTMGSNVGATKSFGGGGGEPSIPGAFPGAFGGASVWWNWTASASGETTIDTEGSSFNTLLGVFTGSVQNQLTLVAGNDDFQGNPWSRVVFNAVAGTTYRIMVDGFRTGAGFGSPATGSITLNVKGVGGIDFISPAKGEVFTVGDPVTVAISINSDFPNPPAGSVGFYANGFLFATVAAPPYSAIANNLPPGSNTLYVVVADSLGNPVKSPEVTIFVQSIGVTLLTPFEDTMYLNSNPVTVTAWAYLPGGSITNIEFFVDGVKFAEDDAPPYSGVWSNVVSGSHRFTAVGRSETGARYTSQAVNVGVASVILPFGSVWKYRDDGSDQGTAWFAPEFDDSSWASGPAPLGYSDSNGRAPATTNSFGPEANNKFITTYFRQTVTVNGASSLASIALNIERDDGAVVYLNGVELGRFNMPTGVVTSATFAASNAGDDGGTTFRINVNPALFAEGANVFAVEIHQDSPNSSDIWFQMSLQGIPVIIHNLSPLVEVTAPASGAFFLAPTEIELTATASDGDGSVAKVEFFVDGVKVGEDTSEPYNVVWTTPSVAAHVLTAVATDDQGATTTSAEIPIVVYDAAGTPVAKVTAPPDGHVVEGPTNMLVTATANAITGVTNVQFLANGVPFGDVTTPPYSAIWTAPFGTNILTVVASDANGVQGTSPAVTVVITIPPTNVIAPTIARQSPLAGGTVTNLTSINVIFSERVQLVDAADLLINGVPATAVTGNGSLSNFTFTFPQPPYGAVNISWAEGHGILDYGYPSNLPFDGNGPGATWTYNLIDKTLPLIAARTPAPGAIVTNLTEIQVTFTEAVTGVDATDLLVNTVPALGVVGSGVNYTFTVPTPASSGTTTVNVTWITNSGIFDLAVQPNAFNGASTNSTWRFVYDPRESLIQSNSTWRFVKGLGEASEPVSAWRQPNFDDSSWSNAPAPFFFGDPYTNAAIRGTLLSDMLSNYTTIYLRSEFHVENRGEILGLQLNHQSDDGFIAWLNGVEVLRYNVPSGANGDLPYNGLALNAANEPGQTGAAYIVATLTNSAVSRLVNGRNVLAIHAFNQNLTNSSDFGFNAQLYYFPIDPSTVPPRVVSAEPVAGDIYYLTNVTFSFSEGVSGVKASDLLINGVTAASVSSTTNSIYTFHFPQPAYGPVAITWDTNHTIADFDSPPRPFDGSAAASRVNYVLLNPSTPRLITRMPAPSTTHTGLTSVTITFDEPVQGVDASDFLVSGAPAAAVATTDSTTFTFSFVQPPFGTVTIRWATNHAIGDLSEPPAPFYPTRFGHQWEYTLIDPIPSVVLTSPTNNTFFLPPANITLRATATDNDGTVQLVEFFEGGTRLSEHTNAPYVFSLSNLLVGSYTFRAKATDNQGLTRTSAPVVINVVTSLPITLVRGPYLQMGSPTGAVVRWRTDAISDGLVYYGTDVNNLTNIAWETSVTNNHIVQVTDLNPDTKYYYSVGSAAFRLVGGTNDGGNYWFQTSPTVGTRKPTRLWVLGDAGTAGNGSPDRQRSTRDSFYKYAATNGPTDLVLMLGDNAYNTGTDTEHQAAVFDMYPTTLRNKFLWPTIGNHETGLSTTVTDFPYLHIFSLPKAAEVGGVPSGTELYYSFDYGNIHFVCLDSMTSGQTADTPMATWLRNDLEATAQEWIIVFFHHPPYTKGSHNSDTEQDLVRIRQNLVPILEANGVDLVLSGHSHAYERSFLLNGHYGLSTTITDTMKIDSGDGSEDGDGAYRKNSSGEGTVYTVAGSSGQATFATTPDQTFATTNHPAMHISMLQLGSMVIDVSGNRLDAIFLRETGEIQDQFTLTKPSPFPAAPQNLVAVATGPTEVSLAWTDAADNELGYSIERSIDGINFTEVLMVAADTATGLDTGLSANTTYLYRVRGTNSLGLGEYSNVAGATTVLPNSLPRAPIGLVASSDNGIEFFRSQMVLRWQDRSTNESAFQIERSVDGTVFAPVATVAANINTFVDRNLESASFYYYRVRAANALGLSAPSVIAGDETHPQSQLARVGDTVTFHAGSEGVPPIRYQWRYLGAPIAGATSEELILTGVEPFDEGDYSVVVYDGTGRLQSNPAYLFVVGGPQITLEPQDRVAFTGASTSFRAGATGTDPTTFQWFHNGVLIPGATSPLLTLSQVQFADGGGYHVVAANDFGSASSRVASLTVYGSPVIGAIPDIVTEVLTPIMFTVSATDPNSPKLPLTYALAAGAPTNATIHATNGLFQWTPNRSQAPGNHPITVLLRDAARPDLTVSATFEVAVLDYIEASTTTLVMNTGESNSIPIDLYSSAPLQSVQLGLRLKREHLNDLTVEEMLPQMASTTVEQASSNLLAFNFTAVAGQTLQGSQRLAQLHFHTTNGQVSAIVPLTIESLTYTKATDGPEPTVLLNAGRIVILGTQPMIEPRISGGQRQLVLYGRVGTNLTVQSKTSLAPTAAWANRSTVTMTNSIRVIAAPSPTAPVIFYQLRQ